MSKNNNSKKGEENKFNERQEAFIENYLTYENATKAYMIAYEQDDYNSAGVGGNRLMNLSKVKNEIERRRTERNFQNIASPDDLLRYWTNMFNNPDVPPTHQLKASEMLGRYYSMFKEIHEVNQSTDFQVNLIGMNEDERKMIGSYIDADVKYIDHEDE